MEYEIWKLIIGHERDYEVSSHGRAAAYPTAAPVLKDAFCHSIAVMDTLVTLFALTAR